MPAHPPHLVTRRTLLRSGALASGALALGPGFWKRAVASAAVETQGPYGPLQPPDANGIRLPQGFTARVVAEANELVPGTSYRFPIFPDGQATYATPDGGFILVTNSESAPPDAGTSAIRFDRTGQIRAAYRILGDTESTLANCAGGPTPWGTWLSCEEFDQENQGDPGSGLSDPLPSLPGNLTRGSVWECDPTGTLPAVRHPALGLFSHEAVCVDALDQRLYLTEDNGDSNLYRFTPDAYPDLSSGVLEVLVEGAGGAVTWVRLPDPQPGSGGVPTRFQVPEAKKFARGEGVWFDSGIVYVATTSDSRLYAYDTRAQRIEVIYHGEPEGAPRGPLTDVDNIIVSPSGDLFACEDSGEDDGIDIALLTPDLTISRFLQLVGPQHVNSEAAGPIFDPSGRRFYFASQRAQTTVGAPGGAGGGKVYEITGPFRVRRPTSGPPTPGATNTRPPATGGVPREPGQAVTSGQAPSLPVAPLVGPTLGVEVPRTVTYRTARRQGIPVRLTLDEPATVTVLVRGRFRPVATRTRGGRRRLRSNYRLARTRGAFDSAGPRTLSVPLPRAAAELLSGRRTPLRLVLTVTVTDRQGNAQTLERTVLLGPPVRPRRARSAPRRQSRRAA